MSILGTENADETISGIRNVVTSKEGMELITSYLDQNPDRVEDDEFYNYDEDVGAGEIQVGGSEGVQSFQLPQQSYGIPQKEYGVPNQEYGIPQYVVPQAPTDVITPSKVTTTGTLTGTGNSGKAWWKPTTWFSSGPSTKVEALHKDSEILRNVVPIGGVRDNLLYVRKFLTPTSRDNIPLGEPRRVSMQQPLRFEHSSIIASDAKFMPTVQMTEAQFQDMIKTLKLTPMNSQHLNKNLQQTVVAKNLNEGKEVKFASPINVPALNYETPLRPTLENKPEEPKTDLVLPEEYPRKENRRNSVSFSEPQRATPFDFIATGRVHQANPDEVLKRSRSLAQAIEGKMDGYFHCKFNSRGWSLFLKNCPTLG